MSLVNWYRQNFTRSLRPTQKKSPFEKTKRRPSFDTLEDRAVPSAGSIFDEFAIAEAPAAQSEGTPDQGIGSPGSGNTDHGSGSQAFVPSASGSPAAIGSGTYVAPLPDGVLPTPAPGDRYLPFGNGSATGWGSPANVDQTESGSPSGPGSGSPSSVGSGSGSGSASTASSASGDAILTLPEGVLPPPPPGDRYLPFGNGSATGWGSPANNDQTQSGSPSDFGPGSGSPGTVGSGSSAEAGSGSASGDTALASTSEGFQTPPQPAWNSYQSHGSGSAAGWGSASANNANNDYGSGSADMSLAGTGSGSPASYGAGSGSGSTQSSASTSSPVVDGGTDVFNNELWAPAPGDRYLPFGNGSATGWGDSTQQTASQSGSSAGYGSGSSAYSGNGSGSANTTPGSGSGTGNSDMNFQQAIDAVFATMV
jgi:hypothetical protein